MGESKRRRDFERQHPSERLGDAPVQAEYHEKMDALTRVINEVLNGDAPFSERKVGFVLMVFPFGETTGRCNFMSNGADRQDVVTLMKEMIAYLEGQPEITGRA